MSMLAALKAYLALSQAQKRLLKSKRLEASYTPQGWLSLLSGLARYDAHADKLRRFSGIAFFVLIMPVFFSGAIPPLMLITVPLWLACALVWWLTRRADLSNHLRLFIMPLVTLLADDVKPGELLHLKLDLRGGTAKDKRTGKKEPYGKGAYYKIVETLYDDPWLSGDAPLSDGSRLQWALTDAIRQLKKTKRTARGKIKSKTKYKIKGLMDAQLRLPAERYQVSAATQPGSDGVRLDVRPGEKWIAVRGRLAVPRAGDKLQSPALEPMLDLLTRLYAKAERKPQGEVAHA